MLDLELTRRVRGGDRSAVETFLQRLRIIPRVLNRRNDRLGGPCTPSELDDLSQEVFTRIWSRLGDYRGEAALETWVYRFCCWTLLDYLRGRKSESVAGEWIEELPDRGSERELGAALDDLHLLAAVAELPAEESEVISLKQLEGCSFEEVGRRLSISPNTAKTRYYRAIERLRRVLGPSFGESSQ